METELVVIPDDALADALRRLPAEGLAAARCVCKAWRVLVDDRGLLLPHLLPHSVRGIFINYVDHKRPHLFARPSPETARPKIDAMLSFLPNDDAKDVWSVMDHCNGLLLCDINWGRKLCVCNPATQRWTLLPPCGGVGAGGILGCSGGVHLVFDPAVSPHYEVVLIPALPQEPVRKKQRRELLDWYQEVRVPAIFVERKKQRRELPLDAYQQEVRVPAIFAEWTLPPSPPPLPPTVWKPDEDEEADDDPHRLMEWPPTPWQVSVFSSRMGHWVDRSFVREGEPAGTVKDMRLELGTVSWMRRRCAVYRQGALYVHCQGSFITRLSMSKDRYRVITAPTNIAEVKPCLGRSGKDVCFGIVDSDELRVWTLHESCEKMEWILKFKVNANLYNRHVDSFYDNNDRPIRGPWIVEEEDNVSVDGNYGDKDKHIENECLEWDSDSDNDDVVWVDASNEEEDEFYWGDFSGILGFHPYKEVVFLVEPFISMAYHMSTSKTQYLGNSRPDCYFHNSSHGIYESFVYTPCTIGELQEGKRC